MWRFHIGREPANRFTMVATIAHEGLILYVILDVGPPRYEAAKPRRQAEKAAIVQRPVKRGNVGARSAHSPAIDAPATDGPGATFHHPRCPERAEPVQCVFCRDTPDTNY